MEHGGMRARLRAARLGDGLGHGTARAGRGLVLAILLGVVLLGVALLGTWMGGTPTATRVTLTMPCARVDAATVGHRAYGLDQVISTSCSKVSAHR